MLEHIGKKQFTRQTFLAMSVTLASFAPPLCLRIGTLNDALHQFYLALAIRIILLNRLIGSMIHRSLPKGFINFTRNATMDIYRVALILKIAVWIEMQPAK